VRCGNQMSSIGFAARIWAGDHEEHLPADFRSLSNEIGNLRILICPADESRQLAANWESIGETNCSYEIVLPGMSSSDTNVFFRCRVHGHLGYADGTVFDGRRRRTKSLR